MHALNEPAPTVVRLVRGELDGVADPDDPRRMACRPDRRGGALRRAGSGRRARPLSSPGWPSAREEGDRTLDLCAAPGGKASMLAGDVTAVELNDGRARELRRTCADSARPTCASWSPTVAHLPAELRDFDRALVDAPCSGLGVLNRRPDLRWRATPLPELQLELLRSAAERVRPGGTIVYSVCTINAEECEDVVDASGLDGRSVARGGVADGSAIHADPSSCRRFRTSTRRPGSSSRVSRA